MNQNYWVFDNPQLNNIALFPHATAQRVAWGRQLYCFEVADQRFWLKCQREGHNVRVKGFDAEIQFYQTALQMPTRPQFLTEFQVLEKFELAAEPLGTALILKDLPYLLAVQPTQWSHDHVIHLIFKMLDALAQLHDMGYIHADLKPTHFLFDQTTSQCKLIDFEQSQKISATLPQEVLTATPRYMAPELFHGEGKTLQTDLYALGIILLEWFTGQPLQARDYQDWAYLHCQKLQISLPASLQRFTWFLQGLLAKHKHQRIQNVQAAKHRLITEIE